jgi:hypothetical protein|tara:strand:- start:1564 stop:2172 length:609 start_codon:yes stop_codon:yes gene_type:complete
MPPAPPKLPPIVKGARDEYSGAVDILRAMGLKPAHDHFLAAGRPPAALHLDTELPGISAGFELRQGRALELVPLLELPPPGLAKALTPLDRDTAIAAFSFKPTPFSLREDDLGVVPSAIRAARADEAAAAAANANAMKSTEGVAAATTEPQGEKRKRDKKEKRAKGEKKEKKRKRGGDPGEPMQSGPTQSGMSGPDSAATSG